MKHILHIWFYKNWIIIGNFLSLIIEVFLDILK